MNYWIISLLITSLTASICSIYVLRKFAIQHHLFDEPGDNKIHPKPVPYLGGIGIFSGVTLALLIGAYLQLIPISWLIGILLGGVIVLAFGLWDDLRWKQINLPFSKLFYQFLISFIVISIFSKVGINIQFSIVPGLAIFVATLYIVAIINALNVNDGLDGLAGSMTGLALVGFCILAILTGNLTVLIISSIMLFSIIGFLMYNWQPASIFMGDNGSLFLGFMLAILAIIFSGHPLYNFRHFISPLLIIGFPLFDITWVIFTRSIKGKSPFCKSRDYLYDKIHFEWGFSVRQTVLFCCLIQTIFVISGVLIY